MVLFFLDVSGMMPIKLAMNNHWFFHHPSSKIQWNYLMGLSSSSWRIPPRESWRLNMTFMENFMKVEDVSGYPHFSEPAICHSYIVVGYKQLQKWWAVSHCRCWTFNIWEWTLREYWNQSNLWLDRLVLCHRPKLYRTPRVVSIGAWPMGKWLNVLLMHEWVIIDVCVVVEERIQRTAKVRA